MDLARGMTYAVVVIVLGTTLLSGSVLDLTAERASLAAAGSGSADVSVESVPRESIALRRSDANRSTYYLQADAARVRVASVSGRPFLVYELRIPALGFTSVRRYVLTSSSVGRMKLRFARGTFDADNLDRETYEATLVVRIDGDETRTVYRRNVTVEVEE